MGVYTDKDKVASLFRDIEFGTDTVVSETEVNEIIDEVEAEMNGKLIDHYEVPVTGTESVKILGKVARMKSAHLVKTILEAQDEMSDRVQEVQTNLEKKADALMDDIVPRWDEKCCEWIDPRIRLSDAIRKQTSPIGGSVFSSNDTDRVIKRGGDNW